MQSGRPPQASVSTGFPEGHSPLEDGLVSLFTLFESSPALVALFDGQGRLTNVNRAFASSLGFVADELQGRLARAFVERGDRKRLLRFLSGQDGAENVDLRWHSRDGSVRSLDMRLLGKLETGHLLAVCQDSTRRDFHSWPPAADLSLVSPDVTKDPCSVCDYTRLYQLSHDLMGIADDAGRILEANNAWRPVFGYRPERLRGRFLPDLIHPDDREKVVACLVDAAAGEAGEVTCRVRRRSRGDQLISWKVAPSTETGSVRVRLVGRNRSEVERVTEQARQLRSFVDSLSSPALSLDESLTVQDANPAVQRLLGYARGEVVGRHVDRLIPGFSASMLEKPGGASTILGEAEEGSFELVGLRSDDLPVPLMVSVTRASYGSRQALVVVARDLTEQARALDDARGREALAIHTRLANELHDGLLQSLTGASLQLELIQSLFQGAPSIAFERLVALQSSLADEQRELRLFVEEFRANGDGWAARDFTIHERLTQLLERIEKIWNLHGRLDVRMDVEPSVILGHEILRIVHEALVNAARHGGATAVDVRVDCSGDDTRVFIGDNGCGFAFEGSWTHDALLAHRLGPRRIMQRVLSNEGRMKIESSSRGAHLDIRLPTAPVEP